MPSPPPLPCRLSASADALRRQGLALCLDLSPSCCAVLCCVVDAVAAPAHYAPLPGVHLGLQHTPIPPAPSNGHEDGPGSEGDHHTTPTRGDEGVRRVLFQSPTTSSVVEIDGPEAAARLPEIIDIHLDRVRQMIEETVEATMRRVLVEYSIPR